MAGIAKTSRIPADLPSDQAAIVAEVCELRIAGRVAALVDLVDSLRPEHLADVPREKLVLMRELADRALAQK